jgi:elongation factor Ts
MADVTASMVKELRERTGLGMMECKKALEESGGDLRKAEDLMRIKSGAKATKAAGRVAAEGVVATHISVDGKTGAIVELNSETDFVAKNEEFIALAKTLAGAVAAHAPADVAALANTQLASGQTVEQARQALVMKLGENLQVRRFAHVQAEGKLTSYVHGGAKIASLVDVGGGDDTLAKDIAMHVAASKPVALSKEQVPADLIQRERDIAAAKAAESGKPAEIVAKMVEGSVNKYLQDVTLLGQPFVKGDGKQTIEQLLKTKSANVSQFHLYVVGEGIEKKHTDFAAEVMAQVNKDKDKDK